MKSAGEVGTLPLVSVIMPVRNEVNFIRRSLGAVLDQNYPHEKLEVLIADGMSTDATREKILLSIARVPDVHVRIIDNPEGIVPTGFNRALSHARGDVIVRVDGHTLIDKDYVRACVEALKDSGVENVGGRMNAVGETYVGKAIACATSSRFGVGGGRFHYSDHEEFVDTVYMGAWPRRVFLRCGGFDEEMVRNQDDEFNYRIRGCGGKILLSPRIKSIYYNRSSLRALWLQYFQYGYWKVRILQKHPRQMRYSQFVPGIFVAVLAMLTSLTTVSSLAVVALALILVLYSLACLAASIIRVREVGIAVSCLLPVIYALLHTGYGTGFLTGLVRFMVTRGRRQGAHVPHFRMDNA